MQLNPSEISDLIKSRIQNLQLSAQARNEGTVVSIADGICRIHGLADAMQGEMLEFPGNTYGLALNLERDSVGAVVLGDFEHISEGDTVKATGRILEVPVGPELLGRVVNALGQPIDGKGPIEAKLTDKIEKVAPGVIWRKSVSQPVQTGLKAVDTMIPIARPARADHRRPPDRQDRGGRRYDHQPERPEHVLHLRGDRAEGLDHRQRSAQARRARRDGIHHRRRLARLRIRRHAVSGRLCRLHHGRVFPRPRHGRAHHLRRSHQAGLGLPPDFVAAAPSAGARSYPGDVFYLHSRLLERAARVNEQYVENFTKGEVKGKTGSLTALPIIETQAGDVSAFVPTNVISITDGQIFLETDLFNAGIRPAVNPGISVSRVGGAAQTKVIKKLSGGIRTDLAQYRELAAFAQFASDLDEATRKQLERGRRVTELLKQPQYSPMNIAQMAVSLLAVNNGFFDDVPVEKVLACEHDMHQYVAQQLPDVMERILKTGELSAEDEQRLKDAIAAFKKSWV